MSLAVTRLYKKSLFLGVVLVMVGLLMPLVINVENFGIYETLYQALQEEEGIYVLYAALKLVALNSLRCLPHYLGAFFIGESLHISYNGRALTAVRLMLVCAIIPLVYYLIGRIYGIYYDFGVPAVLLIVLLIMVEKANLSLVNISKKTLMVALMITAVQFNDVMPALAGLPFGRGEASNDIKMVSHFLGVDGFLQFTATLLFLLLFFSSVLLCKLIVDENNLKLLGELKEQNQRMHTQQRLQMMEDRTHRELQYLVHDLKTPLTSAQALVSVVKLGREQESDRLAVEYLTRVEQSMENMSYMISEILYEEYRTTVQVGKLGTLLLAQISTARYAPLVEYTCHAPLYRVEVNEIRMIRALINVIENAYYALDSKDGRIGIQIDAVTEKEKATKVRFRISDNGSGISPELLPQVWQGGFSTRSSHGLGLLFVRQVVERNGGEITLDSTLGQGTTVTIFLPVDEEERM